MENMLFKMPQIKKFPIFKIVVTVATRIYMVYALKIPGVTCASKFILATRC